MLGVERLLSAQTDTEYWILDSPATSSLTSEISAFDVQRAVF